MTEQHPEARDAFNIHYPAVRKMLWTYHGTVRGTVKDSIPASPLNVSAEQLAELLVFSVRGVRQIPQDVETLRILVEREISLFIAAVEPR